MIFLYEIGLLFITASLFWFIILAFIVEPKFRAGFWQKIGFYPKNTSGKKTVLIHAVSVGEVNAVENLVKKMRLEFPEDYIVLSTVTKTGQEVAQNKLSNYTDEIIYFPYDFFFSIMSCFEAIKPDKIIIAETEIWPMFSYIAKMMKIPLILINGRISPTSYTGYKCLSFFFKEVLECFSQIFMQTEEGKKRIVDIGAPEEKTDVMGNLKFDIEKNLTEEQVAALKNEIQIGENRLFIAASTHKGEDEIALNVFRNIKMKYSDAKLLIAPRHPQRYEQVENMLKNEPYSYSKRSIGGTFAQNDIIMLDTMGELGKFYALGYLAFIGGSFSNTGGHNPLEASIWDVPVISGPTVFNFKDIYKLLTRANVAQIVSTEEDFIASALKFYSNISYHDEISAICRNIFDSSRGALGFVIDKLKS